MPNLLNGAGAYLLEEKRSKFYACCEPVTTEADARAVIERVRAEHRTASHHVYAYTLQHQHITRHSDDGEPQGTAGLPVLNVFTKQEVVDYVCVVTRYFGGTLLGTGGLVRAYGKAAKGALDDAGAEPLVRTVDYKVTCSYAKLEQMKYYFERHGIAVMQMDYGEQVEAVVRVTEAAEEMFRQGSFYEIKG